MGRKSSAKGNTPPPEVPPAPARSRWLPVAALGAVVLAVGVVMYVRSGTAPAAQAAPTPQPAAPAASQSAAATPDPAAPPVAALPADLKAHPQANLPPLRFPGYEMQRPADVVRADYQFAAEHPEVLSYVPCYCGCERAGHRGNEDCFVKTRDVNGDVVEWEDHGMECAVCLDVATRARQMFASGASVADIRAAVEKEWSTKAGLSHTPTPDPPHHH
jgi:hypothetical protein